MPRLISVQVGLPKQYEGDADKNLKPWTTGIFKKTVDGSIGVHELGIEGDGQADLINHGGIDKSVLSYSADNFRLWNEEYQTTDFTPGSFGENLTLENIGEEDVCIGDRWKFGEVILEVSQPRMPCAKLSRRWSRPDLHKRVIQTRLSGWYYRVVQTGIIEAGLSIELIERKHPEWTIMRANDIRYERESSKEETLELASLPELSASWQDPLRKRAEK